jgi:hypothetical protein
MLQMSSERNLRRKSKSLKLKSFGESIILQSIEDLWNPLHRKQSIRFFKGKGFGFCAEIAGMGRESRDGIMSLLERIGISHWERSGPGSVLI